VDAAQTGVIRSLLPVYLVSFDTDFGIQVAAAKTSAFSNDALSASAVARVQSLEREVHELRAESADLRKESADLRQERAALTASKSHMSQQMLEFHHTAVRGGERERELNGGDGRVGGGMGMYSTGRYSSYDECGGGEEKGGLIDRLKMDLLESQTQLIEMQRTCLAQARELHETRDSLQKLETQSVTLQTQLEAVTGVNLYCLQRAAAVEGLQRQIRELSKRLVQAVDQRDQALLRIRDLEEQMPSVQPLELAAQEAFKSSEGDAEEDFFAVIAAMRARVVELETALLYAHERANTHEASGRDGEGKKGRQGVDALSAGRKQERTWWEREVRQKVEEVVRGLLGVAVAAREAEDEVWKFLDLVALEGEKMEEELVQTKENAKAEAAKLNAEILSLQIMCAGLEEQHGYATILAHTLYSEFNSHILGH
jgi:hypothetical protein